MTRPEQPRMVTPEAVALDFTTANLGSRILAFVIDAMIIGVVSFLAILMLVLTHATLPEWLLVPVVIILLPGWYFGYFVVSETLWRGRTVGKAALGLRVVTKEGGPVRFRHAAIRALLGLVDFSIGWGFFGVLFILLTRDNQRLGDLLAGTLVLRERSGLPAPAPVSFEAPTGLEPYAATLDVSGLTVEQYQAVRTFLLRAPSLPPHPRASLAVQLATPLAERLRPPPPAGVWPELFLLCVAAAYQRRQRAAAGRPEPALTGRATVASDPGPAPAPPASGQAPASLGPDTAPAAPAGSAGPGTMSPPLGLGTAPAGAAGSAAPAGSGGGFAPPG